MVRARASRLGAIGVAMVVAIPGCGSADNGGGAATGGHANADASVAGTTSTAGGTGSGGATNAGGDAGRTDRGGASTAGATNAGGSAGMTTGSGGRARTDAGAGGGSGGGEPDASTGADGGDKGDAGNEVVTLNVDVSRNVHPISPLIYGVNPGSVACSDPSARFTLCRLGGNPWSTYNWENNASNAGDGRCFENNDALGASNVPGQTVASLMDEAVSRASLLTMPIIDYVAADKNGGSGQPLCVGDVRDSGSQYLDARFRKNRARKGAPLSAPPDTTDAFVNQDEFVNFVKARATAQILFAMDNQPELWSQTHLAAHPAHATYAEVASKNVEYASMVREQWPEAKITGGVGYGYMAFLNLQFAPDSAGKPDFISYYLASMKQAADSAGKRLIDYLDVHWYCVAGAGGALVIDPDTTPPKPEIVAERVQAPRSLWDASYRENSWISNDQIGGPIDLLHWFEQRIVAYYPGTKMALSAWSYGGEQHISGAIAAADALGIFGREDVAVAAVEPSAADARFLVGAFAGYRNYDGAGATFGDTSVAATTSDVARVAIYASTDSTTPDRLVLVIINRSASSVATTLSIQHAKAFTSADVYQITAQSPLPRPATGLVATGANVLSFEPPGYSVSVVVPKG